MKAYTMAEGHIHSVCSMNIRYVVLRRRSCKNKWHADFTESLKIHDLGLKTSQKQSKQHLITDLPICQLISVIKKLGRVLHFNCSSMSS